MNWIPMDTWIVVVGILAACSSALLGNFLVLRKMSMMGDAISHAVLPGLALAFILTGARSSLLMFFAAAVVGVFTAVFTQWISKFGRVDRGASMGIVFTTLFALGLLLIVRGADHVDLDPDCVLYGAIELTPMDVVWRPSIGSEVRNFWPLDLGGNPGSGGTILEVPRAALVLLGVFLLNLGFVLGFFKELRISSFDPELATTLGIRADVMHYLLMTLVALTTVASFEAVGSIIVIAMLIVPAATAHLLTDRLGRMIAISLVIAILSAVGGHVAALVVPPWFGFTDTSTSGMMAVVAGLLFAGAVFLAPRHGILAKKFGRHFESAPDGADPAESG